MSAPKDRNLLDQYAVIRNASTEIGNSIFTMITGALAFQKFTPGAVAAGVIFAGSIARYRAADEFWLGPTLGNIWYQWFPPVADAISMAVGIGSTVFALAIIGCCAGFVIDPLLAATGLHQRRLERMINALEDQLIDANNYRGMRSSSPVVARLLDALDIIRSTVAR